MTRPPAPLTPAQQQQLVQQIGQAAAAAVPPGWQQLQAVCRAAGRHLEVDVAALAPDGRIYPVQSHPDLPGLFGMLRTGMYQPGRGTWLSATLVFSPQHAPYADYQPDLEPRWRQVPPPIGFQDELRFFPREDRFVPPWLRQRAALPPTPAPGVAGVATAAGDAGQPAPTATGPDSAVPPPEGTRPSASAAEDAAVQPESAVSDNAAAAETPDDTPVMPDESATSAGQPDPPATEADIPATPLRDASQLRTPRIYDRLDETGHPVVERDKLSAEDRVRVLAYLDDAPIILASRSNGTDAFAPSRTDAVPLTFRTDGTWIWPSAVAYYLREHGVSPDPELVAHIRAAGFAVPEVSDGAQDRALSALTSPAGPAGDQPAPAGDGGAAPDASGPAAANPAASGDTSVAANDLAPTTPTASTAHANDPAAASPAQAAPPANDLAAASPAQTAPPASDPAGAAPPSTASPAATSAPTASSASAPDAAAPAQVAPAATPPAAPGEPHQPSTEARSGPMSQAGQDELLSTIAVALAAAAPEGWQRILFDFMAIGRHANLSCGAQLADGSTQQISVPRELSTPLAQLRRGMYVPNRGTWYTFSLIVEPPLTYRASFNEDDEPEFRTPPAQEHYVLDQERFPRDGDYLPLWFSAHL